MFDRKEFNNERSMINQELMLTDGIGAIGIYGHDNSRTIYIESMEQGQKNILKYSIELPAGLFTSDMAVTWKVSSSLAASAALFDEINAVRKQSTTMKETESTTEKIVSFKTIMDKAAKLYFLNGEQDDYIQKAFKCISDAELTFSEGSRCIIS